jgi:hypothetical protein
LKERFSNKVTESVEGNYPQKTKTRTAALRDAAVHRSSYSHALDGMLKLSELGRHRFLLQPMPGKMRLQK